MSTVRIPKKTYVCLEQGTYPATIGKVEAIESEYGPQVKFYFELENGNGEEPIEIIAWASAKYSEKTKLFAWTRAALGPKFDPNADFDGDLLLNRPVLLNVSIRVSTNGGEFNRVETVLPLPRKQPRPIAQIVQELGYEPEQQNAPEPPPPPTWVEDETEA
jgi:hypothetical protein